MEGAISSPWPRADSKPDLLNYRHEDLEDALHSINLNSHITYETNDDPSSRSFTVIDSNENFKVTDVESFVRKLGTSDADKKVKVVSIFGNSGDGKSHTMNNVFFDGNEVFKMSNQQKSCTLGVCCAFQKYFYNSPILCLDTEGLQGIAQNENQQHRMLMKVLAVSDIIIYRTRAERLNSDMYKFLGTASKIYQRHLSPILHDNAANYSGGPTVIIFHEVHNTWPLESNLVEAPENIIKEKFLEMKLSIDAFSSLHYVGIKTNSSPTDFNPLKSILKNDIENKLKPLRTIRSIYEQLDMLNQKFSGNVEYNIDKEYTLHESLFLCETVCEGCYQRCESTRDHVKNGSEHTNSSACNYQQHLNNKIYLCKKCHLEGRRSIVKINNPNGDWLTKYTSWSFGANSKIDCPRHGEIYRSRWYGNKSPEEICVLSEAVHIWRDGLLKNQVPTHSAQAIVDGILYISDAITSVSAQPTKTVTSWVADNLVNPDYWVPNSLIVYCELCKTNFEQSGLKIHHCRNCGKGVCNDCSKNRMTVPLKLGWGTDLVRVCNKCRDELMKNENGNSDNRERMDEETKNVRVRKYGEVLASAVSSVAAAFEYPKELIKDSVRPEYWAKDSDSPSCTLCDQIFGNNIDDMEQSKIRELSNASGGSLGLQHSPMHAILDVRRHHCRGCGAAVCNKCSLNRRSVPEHGWNSDVRVCDNCWKKSKET